ncbi:MAG: LysR family transcriptional regulator [Alphaproteobacteria bacterium]
MDIKQLEYFMAIADARSFSRAADAVRISQSALSRQIRLLEEELQTTLFDRHGRGVELTDTGAVLRARAKIILGEVETTRHDIATRSAEPSGEVRLAVPPSMIFMVGERVLRRYRREYPKVYLRIDEGTTNDSRERLVAGDADVALFSTAEPVGDLHVAPLVTDFLMLVGPAGAEICAADVVQVEALAELPQIVTPHPNSLRKIMVKAMREKGVRANPVIEATTVGLISHLIELGLGYAVMPYSAVGERVAAGTLSAARIEGLTLSWLIATGRGRPVSEATHRLVAMFHEETADMVSAGDWPTAVLPD